VPAAAGADSLPEAEPAPGRTQAMTQPTTTAAAHRLSTFQRRGTKEASLPT